MEPEHEGLAIWKNEIQYPEDQYPNPLIPKFLNSLSLENVSFRKGDCQVFVALAFIQNIHFFQHNKLTLPFDFATLF